MSCQCHSLGDSGEEIDRIVGEIFNSARILFPEWTAEAEAWMARRLTAYGIDYAKYKAQQGYQSVNDWLSNPYILLGLGLFAGWVIFRK